MAEVAAPSRAVTAEWRRCPSCEAFIYHKRLKRNLYVCPDCNHHFRLRIRDRIAMLLDEGSYEELSGELEPIDALSFSDSKPYPERIAAAQKKSGAKSGALYGKGSIDGRPLVVAPGLERQLGHVELVKRVAGVRGGDPLGGGQRLLGPAERPIHLDERDRGRRRTSRALRHLLEHRYRLAAFSRPEGAVSERRQRGIVLGVDLEHLSEGVVRLVGAPFGREGIPQVTPRPLGVRLQLGDPPELLHGVVGSDLDPGPAGQAHQVHVVGVGREPFQGDLARAAELPCLE